MLSHNPARLKPIIACLGLALVAQLATIQSVSAQGATSREVVQPLPSPEIQRLNRALLELARRPNAVSSLLEAAEASMVVGDLDAAIGFYGRAADLAPNDPRVKLGLGQTYLQLGRPTDAIPLLNAALTSGAQARDVLSDQALAFDLIGDTASAQTAYARAIELNPQDDEARRRLALSHAISGNIAEFQSALAPLITARDPAAFRTRAFGLAILGEQDQAVAIVTEIMPRDLATRINPYLAYMPRLTASQQAAAANLGIFPRAADIGRDDPRLARFASEGTAGALLEPSGEPLGQASASDEVPAVATVSQEVVQVAAAAPAASAPTPEPDVVPVTGSESLPAVAAAAVSSAPVEPAEAVAKTVSSNVPDAVPDTAPVPGFDLAATSASASTVGVTSESSQVVAAALPQVATAELPPTPATAEQEPAPALAAQTATVQSLTPTPIPQPTTPTSSVADAFADFGSAELPTTTANSSGAVDLAAIEIPREGATEPESAEPDHPRRIWVQLATGRDVDALKFDWRRFNRRAPELLGDFEPHVTPWGQANRLLAGPVASRDAARALINGLSEKGVETFSYISPEGTEIQELK